jgi:hypothetical protein
LTYQQWDKNTEINEYNKTEIIKAIFFTYLLNDFINCITKTYSNFKYATHKVLLYAFINIFQLIAFIYFFRNINIEGYYKSFLVCKCLFFFLNTIKTVCASVNYSFAINIFKFIDTVWLTNMMLIAFTDPIMNNETYKNKVTFYEVYFRFLEYYILVMAFSIIYNDKNIDEDVARRVYTFAGVIGKHDSYRFIIILILAHYYFILINSLAFSLR